MKKVLLLINLILRGKIMKNKKKFLLLCVLVFALAVSSCKEDSVKPQEPFQPPQTAEELKNMLQGEWVDVDHYEASKPSSWTEWVADSAIYIAIFYGDSVKGIENRPKFYKVSSPERVEMQVFAMSYKAMSGDTLEVPRVEHNNYMAPPSFPMYINVSFHSADSITITRFWPTSIQASYLNTSFHRRTK